MVDIHRSSGQARRPWSDAESMNLAVGRHCLEGWWQTFFSMALSTKLVKTCKLQCDRTHKSWCYGKA